MRRAIQNTFQPLAAAVACGMVLPVIWAVCLVNPVAADPVESEQPAAVADAPEDAPPATEQKTLPPKIRLFDGKTLDGWKVLDQIDFLGHGPVLVKDGELILSQGQAMTGIKWERDFPKMNYEITLETRRIQGGDFFCGMTFPVGESHCSLILGGWGGMMTGLSCVDGFDASENETTGFANFVNEKWYQVRLRVTEEKIEAWLDDEQIVDLEHADRDLSLRWEMDQMPPFGIATWYTTGGYRNLEVRRLDQPAED